MKISSDEPVPTWWTQHPSPTTLLTGWLSGPEAEKSSSEPNSDTIAKAIDSLSAIFKMDKKLLRSKLMGWKVVNWVKDEFALGSYSYATVDGDKHKNKIRKPEKNTLFFAGEYLEEPAGTVEAAFLSGFKVADKILE